MEGDLKMSKRNCRNGVLNGNKGYFFRGEKTMKTKRTGQFGLVCVMVCGLLATSTTMANILYSTGFEASEGFANGGWIGYNTAMDWGKGIPSWGCKEPAGVKSDAPFSGDQYALMSNYKRGNTKTFNTDPTVGNETVWVEAYMKMGNLEQTNTPYFDFGLFIPETTTLDVVIHMPEYLNRIAIRINDSWGTGNVFDADIKYTPDEWWHFVMEVDYVADTVKLYGKAVSPGDTSPLTTDDLITFGGNSVIPNAVQGNYAGDLYFFLSGVGADASIDGIKVADSSLIVPEPATIGIMVIGVVGFISRKR